MSLASLVVYGHAELKTRNIPHFFETYGTIWHYRPMIKRNIFQMINVLAFFVRQ